MAREGKEGGTGGGRGGHICRVVVLKRSKGQWLIIS